MQRTWRYIADMALDPVEWYLHWFHKRTKKRWATYEPQVQRVKVGDFGWFDDDLLFRTAPDWNIDNSDGVECDVMPDESAGDLNYFEDEQLQISIGGGAKLPLPLHTPITVKAGTKIEVEAIREHWCALQLQNASFAQLYNTEAIKEKIRDMYLRGEWRLDRYLVTERIQCTDGFAILGEGRDKGFSIELSADVTLLPGKELVSGSLSPAYRSSGQGWETYNFAGSKERHLPTPSFSAPMGISRRFWGRLLRTKKFGAYIEDASGDRYPIGMTPINLDHLPDAEQLHQPWAEGVMSKEEILAIPLDEFIEEFWDLDKVVFSSDRQRGPSQDGQEGATVTIELTERDYSKVNSDDSETFDELFKKDILPNWTTSREPPSPTLPAGAE